MVTLELVPHRESFGKTTDTLIGIARDAFADGRIAAVSLRDNPGGNPSLSPDVRFPRLKPVKPNVRDSTGSWIKKSLPEPLLSLPNWAMIFIGFRS